jgi:predicted methyltransferase
MVPLTLRFNARALGLTLVVVTAAVTALVAAGPVHGQAEKLDLGALGRPAEEVTRDATSKPLAVYELFEIRSGSAVADLFAGGGYNTAILTHVVGPEGVVFSENSRRNAIGERKANGDLKDRANVVVFQRVEELPAESLDVALTVRNYHDVPAEEIGKWLAAIHEALKPGGVFGVVDVRTEPGFRGRAADLHRISEQVVVEEVTGAGFVLEARSDLLSNPKDAYGSSEFENREGTDRMVLKFRRVEVEEAAGE